MGEKLEGLTGRIQASRLCPCTLPDTEGAQKMFAVHVCFHTQCVLYTHACVHAHIHTHRVDSRGEKSGYILIEMAF